LSTAPLDDPAVLQEKILDLQDELATVRDEKDALTARVAELEALQLSSLQAHASTSDSDKDARIAELVRENQELMVVMKNMDGEGELRRQERKHERLMEKCKVYEEGLEASLAEERKVRLYSTFFLLSSSCLFSY
jgi:hypothetical protein